MKATGIICRVDDLGRVVIPKEIRRALSIREGEPLEILTEGKDTVCFRKCEANLSDEVDHLNDLVYDYIDDWEEKARKDKLWKVEATISDQGISAENDDCLIELKNANIPINYIYINKYILVNCYCATQAESKVVKEILNKYNAKYFVSESKTL